MSQPSEDHDDESAVPIARGGRLGQLFALICGAVGLAFIGVFFKGRPTRQPELERTPKEAADEAVTAALAAKRA